MEFYCSRCGARLQAPDDWGNSRVRCGGCAGVTRTPDASQGLPTASVVETELSLGSYRFDDTRTGRPIGDDEALGHLLGREEPAIAEAATAEEEPPLAAAVDELAGKLNEVRMAEGERGS